ncbi:MAG: hypothetical protein HYR76_10345 [Ignavibacteria bacterium]|nr:hypothetical protein [Ignavibacteria bacterium]MBI3765690.1 hypothetical protein [Ignavibacteriales bacterium]
MIKYLRFAALLPLFFLLLFVCEKKPQPCPTCNGIGKVTHSENIQLPFEITTCNVTDKGFFDPDYFADVTVENKGDEDGTFIVFVDFEYQGIGPHTEQSEIFIKAHSQATKQIHYDPDKKADKSGCRVSAPTVIHTTQTPCLTCQGGGVVK